MPLGHSFTRQARSTDRPPRVLVDREAEPDVAGRDADPTVGGRRGSPHCSLVQRHPMRGASSPHARLPPRSTPHHPRLHAGPFITWARPAPRRGNYFPPPPTFGVPGTTTLSSLLLLLPPGISHGHGHLRPRPRLLLSQTLAFFPSSNAALAIRALDPHPVPPMSESTHHTIRRAAARPRGWCCSFSGVPDSPEHRELPWGGGGSAQKLLPPPKSPLVPSFHSSPSSKLAGLIDPRRILSPGRVSPIDSVGSPAVAAGEADEEALPRDQQAAAAAGVAPFVAVREDDEGAGGLDLRLSLRGTNGRCVVMELDSAVLCQSSAFFAGMVPDASASGGEGAGGKRIEVDGVDNLEAFKGAVELMFEPDAMRWLARVGVSRAIGVLEVSSSIMFDRGIESCLKYIEAVPWNENEEEKLKHVFARCTFDESVCKDVLARLQQQDRSSSEDLTVQLVESVTSGTNNGARKELHSLVTGLLSKSSVYHKDLSGLNKGSLYQICRSCLSLLVELFVEDSRPGEGAGQSMTVSGSKPMIERVSKQTENLNWLFDILVNNDMAEEFVELWAKQDELIRMHEQASPMFRYELSRISASVFIALGKGRIQCPSEMRSHLFYGWFRPTLMDFSWLRRGSKALDVRTLEENLGQALLTLPLQHQQSLFEWFRCFASRGTECPNLSRAFQVWWRRSFVRSSVEARR
ncbi:unnamed protein product [Urochloa humidicola]